jgi:hypothetical protein
MIVLLVFHYDRECAPQPFLPERIRDRGLVPNLQLFHWAPPSPHFAGRAENGETGLSPHVPLQLLHLSLDHQIYRFMGCDCHIELMFKSWKSDLHLATLPTKTEIPTLCYLYGRLLLIVLAYALGPALRTALWTRQQHELSFLKLIRYLQALADRWLQALFESPALLRAFLSHVCVCAQRVIAKASRKCRTSAQRLRESLEAQNDCIKLTIKLAA